MSRGRRKKASPGLSGSERARRWQEENAAAMEDYRRFIEAGGVPLSEFRKF